MRRMAVARPAIPLAACPFVLIGPLIGSPASFVERWHLANRARTQLCGLGLDLAHKIGCYGNVLWRIEKLSSARSSIATVLPTLQIGWKSVGYMLK